MIGVLDLEEERIYKALIRDLSDRIYAFVLNSGDDGCSRQAIYRQFLAGKQTYSINAIDAAIGSCLAMQRFEFFGPSVGSLYVAKEEFLVELNNSTLASLEWFKEKPGSKMSKAALLELWKMIMEACLSCPRTTVADRALLPLELFADLVEVGKDKAWFTSEEELAAELADELNIRRDMIEDIFKYLSLWPEAQSVLDF